VRTRRHLFGLRRGRTLDFAPAEDGSTHVFAVRAVACGVTGSSVERTFMVDAVGPSASIVSPAPGETTSATGTIAIVADNDSDHLTCLLGTVETPCTSTSAPFTLDDGSHTFSVQAFDALGNPGASSSVTWTVDASPPNVVSLTAMNLGGSNTRISYQLSDASGVGTVRCRLDGGAFTDCGNGPTGQVDFAVGTGHLVEVYGVDIWGQSGESVSSAPPPSAFARIQF